jgi:two-component system, chemotaxis family, sensor kinase CheA
MAISTVPEDFADLADFLSDYVAECDEHLTAAGRVLLDIEAAPERVERGQLEGLFRNFHTVKGLSGMVGLREAERLAHSLESYLGAIRKRQVAFSPAGIDLLIEGVRMLERIIAARRDDVAPPEVEALIDQVVTLLPKDTAPATAAPLLSEPTISKPAGIAEDRQAKIDRARQRGLEIWRVTFIPTPALAERGISVNTVREQLQGAGELLYAEPIIAPGREISFDFFVASRDEDFRSAVNLDGLTVVSYAPTIQPGSESIPGSIRPVRALSSESQVRVDLGRLDDLMRTVGELVITRARLDNSLERVSPALRVGDRRELQETSLTLERQLRTLREGVMRVRLVPVRDAFARMQFVVRDLARETGKDVGLELIGETTEIDKFVVERLADPLLHLVRNAVSHGIELPAERIAVGKPPRGRLSLRAATAGGAVLIEVEDDGRGIDPELIFSRARELGLVPTGMPVDAAGVLEVISAPGFSTRETADRASGRGVGMDVVRRAVEELGGDLALDNRLGRGARFTARLPLTLAIADALIIAVGGQTFAVPQVVVREVVHVEVGAATALENNELLRHREGVLPLLRLTDLFGMPRPKNAFSALIVGDGGQAFAVAADRVLGLREIVVRPLADPLVQAPGLAGATELGDGRAVLILDTAGLARAACTRPRPSAAIPGD